MLLAALIWQTQLNAQISPGELAEVHAHLEGISNCTKCHTLGEKVSDEKCLDCHTEIKVRVENNRGYHASKQVKGHTCVKCHNDHHGRNFQIIRFEKDTFNHHLTGYQLRGAHAQQSCDDCHQKQYITDASVLEKDFTYLGLGRECLTCHEDYHQGTLSQECENCHGFRAFDPALNFDHAETDFPLKGQHQEVDCAACHEKITRNGKPFQRFSGIDHSGCISCHEDVHNGRFGTRCGECHTVESFHIVKTIDKFDHSRTDFPLEGKHRNVDCKQCHTGAYTDPLSHDRCTDCHEDYHNGQFTTGSQMRNCDQCHTVSGFAPSTFGIEDHRQADFKLEGAHLATPCFACHLRDETWTFRNIGTRCVDCHEDIHNGYIDVAYYPEKDCENCHRVSRWAEITFEHEKTGFALEGQHAAQPCRACHFEGESGAAGQQFASLNESCMQCHTDVHFGQFRENGNVDCASCHGFSDWSAEKFDHSKAAFQLDGAHEKVACGECHKPVTDEDQTYIQYKFEDYRCETCHK